MNDAAAGPLLLIDDTLVGGTVNVLPAAWLRGCRARTYPSGDLDGAGRALAQADAILLRSVTKVTADHVMRAPRLKAVATLSSGTDHVDERALSAAGIPLFTGRGGNAIAVADWVQWALTRLLGSATRPDIRGFRAVVIGCGAVGGLVSERLGGLGAEVIEVDPPRAQREPGYVSVDLDAALATHPRIVTLHTPLTRGGPYATADLLNAARLERLDGALVLNAARGGVLDERAAGALRRRGGLRGLAVDTFEHEPRPDASFVAACDLATPHIGGHSIEGKLRVAALPVMAVRACLGLPAAVDLPGAMAAAVDQPHGDRPFARDPLAALDMSSAALKSGPGDFKAHRAAHWRIELRGAAHLAPGSQRRT